MVFVIISKSSEYVIILKMIIWQSKSTVERVKKCDGMVMEKNNYLLLVFTYFIKYLNSGDPRGYKLFFFYLTSVKHYCFEYKYDYG